MLEIVAEGALFVMVLAAAFALLAFFVLRATPLGLRVRQTRNRLLIEQAANRVCPVHGPHEAAEMVLLRGGDRICPECFKEAVNG
jgi:hypothetical protein